MAYAITFIVILLISAPHAPKIEPVDAQIKKINKEITSIEKQLATVTDETQKTQLVAKIDEKKKQIKDLEASIKDSKKIISQTSTATAGTNALRVLFFLITFFTIGVMSDFRKLWEEGIGRLAVVYLICLFGFILWIGLLISYIFFHGVKPPVITG